MSFPFARRLLAAALCLLAVWPLNPAAAAATQYLVNGHLQDTPSTEPTDDYKTLTPQNEWWQEYCDYAQGYRLWVPRGLTLDVSLAPVRSLFTAPDLQLEIYHDRLPAGTSSNDYMHYSNHFTTNTADHTITTDRYFRYNGWQVHELIWSRRALAHIPSDRPYYACWEIAVSQQEVYTILVKSRQPYDENGRQTLLNSFQHFEPHGTARYTKPLVNKPLTANAATTAWYQQHLGPAARWQWGIFEPSAPETPQVLESMEETLRYRFPVVLRYQTLAEPLPRRGLERAHTAGRTVELTFQTVGDGTANALLVNHLPQDNARVIYALLDGVYDDYLAAYAAQLKEFGQPVLFRLNNEMNGDWCWYSAYYTGKDTDVYKALWIYLYQYFKSQGVDNLIWVWNPHDVSRPDFAWNHYLLYYPGDEYVDVIGMTGYNTGTYFPGETWREFPAIYRPLYQEYSALFPQPFIISEFGSNSVGGNKVRWLQTMFDTLHEYPNIKLAIWWNGIDYDQQGRPGRIYLLDEDEATTSVFRNRLPQTPAK